MTRRIRRCSPRISAFCLMALLARVMLSSSDLKSDSISEANPIEPSNSELSTPTQRLIDKLNELDERHIMREKVISGLRYLLTPEGYRALDLETDDIVARLYLLATVHPLMLDDVLSYHKDAITKSYLDCLQNVESKIRLSLDYMETAGDIERSVAQTVNRVLAADLSSEEGRNITKRWQRLLFVMSLQQHARQGVKWKETSYGKIETKLAVQRRELEQTFESMPGADFESSFASVIILNWPAWSYQLTCGKNDPSLELSASQPEQTPSFPPTSPRAEPNGNGSSSALEPQPIEKKLPTVNTQKKPLRKVTSQEWMQIR